LVDESPKQGLAILTPVDGTTEMLPRLFTVTRVATFEMCDPEMLYRTAVNGPSVPAGRQAEGVLLLTAHGPW
jgi:hypothetical protein